VGLAGRYRIELCGEDGGIDAVIDSDDRLASTRRERSTGGR